MTLTTISACVAATLSLCVSQAPSQPRDLRDANLHAIPGSAAGGAGAWTKAVTAPAGAKLILAGIRRG